MDIKVDADFDLEVKEEIEFKPVVSTSCSSDEDVAFVRRDKIIPDCFIVNKTEFDSDDDDCLIVNDNSNVARSEDNNSTRNCENENVSSLLKTLLRENSPNKLNDTTSKLKEIISDESPQKLTCQKKAAPQIQKTVPRQAPQKKILQFKPQQNNKSRENSPNKLNNTTSKLKKIISDESPQKLTCQKKAAPQIQKTVPCKAPQKKNLQFKPQQNNKSKNMKNNVQQISPEVSLIQLNPQTSNEVWTSLSKHLLNKEKRMKKKKGQGKEAEKRTVALVAPQPRAPTKRPKNPKNAKPPKKRTKMEDIKNSLTDLRNEIAELRALLKEKK